MSTSTSYKPSPLSYNSPNRASPFRRPESPASPSPLRNSTTTPTSSPSKQINSTPSNLFSNNYVPAQPRTPASGSDSWTPRGLVATIRNPPSSPTRGTNSSLQNRYTVGESTRSMAMDSGHGNALAQLKPAQVRELREGFQILDRDNDGLVGREDVVDMLTQLGLPSGSSDVTPFFPPGAAQTITLPAFLSSIAELLSSLSPPEELLSAFSAFDDDDSGQIDVKELRDALLQTAPEPGVQPLTEREVDRVINMFSGRRAFGKNTGGGMGKRGEVFKYQEFVASVAGGPDDGKAEKADERS